MASRAENIVASVMSLRERHRTAFDFKVMALSIVEKLNQVPGYAGCTMGPGTSIDYYGYELYDEMASEAYQNEYRYLLYSYSTPIYDRPLCPHEIESYFKGHDFVCRHVNPTEDNSGGIDYKASIYEPWQFVAWPEIDTLWKLSAWLGY